MLGLSHADVIGCAALPVTSRATWRDGCGSTWWPLAALQEADGGIWEATYVALVRIAPVLCDALAIPFQVVDDPYTGHPLPRFLDGGPTYRGILGHRNNTEQRGRGDPGDEAIARLVAAGAEPVLAGQGQCVGSA